MNHLNILQWNVRGFTCNKPFIERAINDLSPNILCLQETKANPNTKLTIPNFICAARCERNQGKGGGCAILCKNDIPFTKITLPPNIEGVGIIAHTKFSKITILSLYFPPSLNLEQIKNNLIDLTPFMTSQYLICVDANAHHLSWGSPNSDSRGEVITEWLESNNSALLNDGHPTYLSNAGTYTHIDLTISSPQFSAIKSWKVNEHPYHSDHMPISISSDILIDKIMKTPKFITEKADWIKYQKLVNIPDPKQQPTDSCNQLEHAIINAAIQSIPQTKTNSSFKKSNSWWNDKCHASFKEKRLALTKYKKNRGDINMWIIYKQKRAIFRHIVKQAKKESWETFVSQMTHETPTSEVWNKVKSLNNVPTNRNIILKEKQSIITSPKEVANLLGADFANRGTNITPETLNPLYNTPSVSHSQAETYNQPFTLIELNRVLKNKKSSSPGPDKISYELITHLADDQKLQLLKHLNWYWKNGIPNQWKTSIVIPILKPGKPSSQTPSYRPISLTNCLCKIFEKIVNSRLLDFLISNKILSQYQSGFLANRSTLDSLCLLENDIRENARRGKSTLAVFIDITQAFDSVYHNLILNKAKKLGIKGNMLCFIKNFLSDRTIRVRIHNILSEVFQIKKGVPQGSVISPTLFLIVINDIAANCPQNIKFSLYADDCAIWSYNIPDDQCHEIIQKAIDHIHDWSKINLLKISAEKTKVVYFSNKHKNPPPLTLDGTQLSYNKEVKFLGILFDKRMTWKPHITSIKERCAKDLRLLNIISYQGWGADFLTLKRIYNILILSKINYGSCLFNTAAQSNLTILYRIQYAAARTMLGALRCTKLEKLEITANLLPLKLHWQKYTLKYALRTLTISQHPIRQLLLQYYPMISDQFLRQTPPIISRMYDLLTKIKLKLEQIDHFPQEYRYKNFNLSISEELHMCSKENLSETAWVSAYRDLCQKYSNFSQIFTDGSLTDKNVGCAVWSENFKLQAKLPPHYSIFSAEMYSIYSAVSFIQNFKGNFVIFTDSLSSVRALKNASQTKHSLTLKTANLLSSTTNKKIVIEWIPSHVGIEGNENADKLAKETCSISSHTTAKYPLSDLNHMVTKHYLNIQQLDTKFASGDKILNSIQVDNPPEFLFLRRRDQICITRLMLRTCRLTHGHYFLKTSPPFCTPCNAPKDLGHIFIICPLYNSQRQILIAYCIQNNLSFCMQSLFSLKCPSDIIIQFLKDTDNVNQI